MRHTRFHHVPFEYLSDDAWGEHKEFVMCSKARESFVERWIQQRRAEPIP